MDTFWTFSTVEFTAGITHVNVECAKGQLIAGFGVVVSRSARARPSFSKRRLLETIEEYFSPTASYCRSAATTCPRLRETPKLVEISAYRAASHMRISPTKSHFVLILF